MKKREYSAGMVKLPFWFSELKKMIHMINEGKSLSEIKELSMAENIFLASSELRAAQLFTTVSNRVKSLNDDIYQYFERSDVSTQKIIALISVMESDSLFLEFMYEVYREKLILGVLEITEKDFSVFFKDKQLQSEKVAKWTDQTLKRLAGSYKSVMSEAGILEKSIGAKKIYKPIIDNELESLLKQNNMVITFKSLTGVR